MLYQPIVRAAVQHMYSAEWFETFAATVPASIIETELDGIGGVLPPDQYPRILGEADERGAVVQRWIGNGRCFNEIRYANGRSDDIQFDVYYPDEMRDLSHRAGLEPGVEMVWWSPGSRPSVDSPRYQLICVRP